MALSSILSTFFITPIFHIFEKWIKILKIPVSFLLFVNDGLFISQERSFDNTNTDLFYSYNIMSSLLEQFELVVEHRKTEIFHFSRSHGFCYPLSLDLSWIGGSILYLKGTWQYLGFIFNRKLTFWQHTKFYANKAVYGQMHENAWQLNMWTLTLSKMLALQNMCSFNCSIWVSSLVLQQGAIIISS